MSSITVEQSLHSLFIERIRSRHDAIQDWLRQYESVLELPLYSSVDIRDAGFKCAVVDTNLFPAGFNNLCEHGLADSVHFMREAVLRRVPACKDVLIIAEEHTRNPWYLENIYVLQRIIEQAGFSAKVSTFLNVEPSFCEKASYVALETATGETVKVYCFKKLLRDFQEGKTGFDLIIMNNDLINGIPDVLKQSHIPIYPSIQAGWHSRKKSHHFQITNDLIREFAALLDLDPWFFSCVYRVASQVDINQEKDRLTLYETAVDLFSAIKRKYEEHGISEKPYIILKADSGTYGMGVMALEEPEQILNLNRKGRNKLHKGKGSLAIHTYLLQEGVPTIYHAEQHVSEVVIYQVENNLVGGFYRSHSGKTNRDNLNSKGMVFEKMCPHLPQYNDCGIPHDINIFDFYRLLARVAAIAAHREIVRLEAEHQ